MTLPVAPPFVSITAKRQHRRLMIGSDGPPDSGKTEFALSAPGPGKAICLDRGIEGMLDNPNPPATRRKDWFYKTIPVPLVTQLTQKEYQEYWRMFYQELRVALDDAPTRAILLDGDSDSWELQRLAEFGRLSKVPPTLYDQVNGARRAMIARMYDANKIVIATNRVRRTFITEFKPDGTPKLNSSGNEVRVWNGEYERQGFNDTDYLWQVQLRHYRNDNGEFCVRIEKCKADMKLRGMELIGDDCNFPSLVQCIYPHVPLKEWGL